MDKELVKYLEETQLRKEDIEWAFDRVRKLESAINKAQHLINEGRADEIFLAKDIDEVKEIANDSKMEIFKLWYLVHTGKDYE